MQTLELICADLEPVKDYLREEGLYKLKQLRQSLQRSLQEEDDANSLLRIGIVGSVKAGKSTFLNALLFNGQDVLPKAATPMTASLTRLRYAENQSARLVFYSSEDWDDIENEALKAEQSIEERLNRARANHEKNQGRDGIPFDEKLQRKKSILDLPGEQVASLELVEETRRQKLDVDAELSKGEEEIPFDNLANVQSRLKEFVGVGGRLTALVRHVELNLCHEILRDLEIVDTPGLNDPVRSRSRETMKFLLQCDAAFVLSTAGQFLTQPDMDLLKRKLPSDGILHQTVIATMMDIAIMDHSGNVATFRDAFLKTRNNILTDFRKRFVGAQCDPIPVSALLDSIACKMEQSAPLLPDEEHSLKKIAEFSGAPQTAKELRSIANMQAVRKELESSRSLKDEIKCRHQIELIRGKNGDLRECLQDLEKAALADKKTLAFVDLEILQNSMTALKKSMDTIRVQLTNLFNSAETNLKLSIRDLKLRIVSNISNFRDLNIITNTREEERSHTTGAWFWKKEHNRTVSITEHHVDTADVIATLRNYSVKTQVDINNAYKDMLPIEQLKGEVKRLVLNAFNQARVEFDEQTVLQPLKASLEKLTVAPFEYNIESQTKMLVDTFGDCIHNEDIAKLKTAQEKALDVLCKETQKRLDDQEAAIVKNLHMQGDNFIDNILSSVTGNVDKLSKQLNDKQSCLAGYEAAVKTVRDCRSGLSKWEI